MLPSLLGRLLELVDRSADDGDVAARDLGAAATDGMGKGEMLVCHVVDTGDAARITAVERYPT